MFPAVLPIECLDTDVLCRELLLPGQPGWYELKERWGDTFFHSDGILDRTLLREAVFADPSIREGLEEILHSRVRDTVAKCSLHVRRQGKHLLVEVPLLFEKGWNTDFDHVISVYAPASCCIARTIARDNVPHHQAESILALQLTAEEKANRADSVVNNSGLWGATVLQVSYLGRNLRNVKLDGNLTA